MGLGSLALLAAGYYLASLNMPAAPVPEAAATVESRKIQPPRGEAIQPTRTPPQPPAKSNARWDGPILYHAPGSAPLHLILVEKAIQKLHLYRYDGNYERLVTYTCGTGERNGPKQIENDEKTPEGIYFNTKIYRDRNITVFGNRAFELNYPNAFDDLAGNGGHGIYIHGSNRKVTPYSTNGCVALNNRDLEDLDGRIQFDKTPVIIGERLPYAFSKPRRDTSKLVPLLRQAMTPKKYTRNEIDFPGITILGYQDKLVSFGTLKIHSSPAVDALSRVYLSEPDEGLMVLVKREWSEKPAAPVVAKIPSPPAPVASKEKNALAELVKSWKSAWENKRLEAYIAHYHPDFVGNGKTLSQWKQHKKRLNGKYKKISVTVSGLRTRTTAKTSRAWFKQRYRSDAFKSNGYKILEFKKKGNEWKIYREESFAYKPRNWPA